MIPKPDKIKGILRELVPFLHTTREQAYEFNSVLLIAVK